MAAIVLCAPCICCARRHTSEHLQNAFVEQCGTSISLALLSSVSLTPHPPRAPHKESGAHGKATDLSVNVWEHSKAFAYVGSIQNSNDHTDKPVWLALQGYLL
jgi:hypothetical protein